MVEDVNGATLSHTVAGGDVVAVRVTATDTHGATSEATTDSVTVAVLVNPASVTFTDECGTINGTYSIPGTTGVEYLVNGQVTGAGSYPGTGRVTVTARATTGYVLAEAATSSWDHTFDATACKTNTTIVYIGAT